MIIKATLLIWLCLYQSYIAQKIPDEEATAICAMIQSIPKLLSYPYYWNLDSCHTACNFKGLTCNSKSTSIKMLEIYSELDYPLLSGSLPTQIGLLKNLSRLDIGLNDFTGTIPTQIGLLTKLTYVHLHDNHLNGTIPTQLGSLKNVTDLSIGFNMLSGTVPAILAELEHLEYFDISNNQLFLCDLETIWAEYTGEFEIYNNLDCPPAPPAQPESSPPQPEPSPSQPESSPPQPQVYPPQPKPSSPPIQVPQYVPQPNILEVQSNSTAQVNVSKNTFDSVNLNPGSSLSVSDTTMLTGELILSPNTTISIKNSTINVGGSLHIEGSFSLTILNSNTIPIKTTTMNIKKNTTLVIKIENPTAGTTVVVMTFDGVNGSFENIIVEGSICARAEQTRYDVSVYVPSVCEGYSNKFNVIIVLLLLLVMLL